MSDVDQDVRNENFRYAAIQFTQQFAQFSPMDGPTIVATAKLIEAYLRGDPDPLLTATEAGKRNG